jgi:hypothetical protein
METLKRLFECFPKPPAGRSPGKACLIGLLFGGIGLGIYLRNIVDLLLPLALYVAVVVKFGDIGVLGSAVLVGLYGYLRVHVAESAEVAPRPEPERHAGQRP